MMRDTRLGDIGEPVRVIEAPDPVQIPAPEPVKKPIKEPVPA